MLHSGLPSHVTVKLQSGQHKGSPQLWAPYSFNRYDHKLIVRPHPADREAFTCKAGETWMLRTTKSPNGHIVFCEPHRLLLTPEGLHPAVEAARKHIQANHFIAIWSLEEMRYMQWSVTADLVNVTNDSVSVKIQYKNLRCLPRSRNCPIEATTEMVMPLDRCIVGEDDYGFTTLSDFGEYSNSPTLTVKFIDDTREREPDIAQNVLFSR